MTTGVYRGETALAEAVAALVARHALSLAERDAVIEGFHRANDAAARSRMVLDAVAIKAELTEAARLVDGRRGLSRLLLAGAGVVAGLPAPYVIAMDASQIVLILATGFGTVGAGLAGYALVSLDRHATLQATVERLIAEYEALLAEMDAVRSGE